MSEQVRHAPLASVRVIAVRDVSSPATAWLLRVNLGWLEGLDRVEFRCLRIRLCGRGVGRVVLLADNEIGDGLTHAFRVINFGAPFSP